MLSRALYIFNTMRSKDLLKEYVKTIVAEDYGYYGGDESSMMGSAGYNDYGKSLKSIFIDPFLDVGKTAAAGVSHMMSRTKSFLKVAIESILTTAIPFMESNYKLVWDHEKKDLARLRDKYKDVFASNSKAFTKDSMLISFMISPEAFITTKAITNSPDLGVHVLEVLAHGNDSLKQYVEDIKKRIQNIEKELKDDIANYRKNNPEKYADVAQRGPYFTKKKRELLKKAGIEDSVMRFGTSIVEASNQIDVEQAKISLLSDVFNDSQFKSLVSQSPIVRQMRQDIGRSVQKLTTNVFNIAQKVLTAKSIEDLEKITGKNFGLRQELSQLPTEEKEQAQQAVMNRVKEAMRTFYVKQLESEVNVMLDQGVSDSNLYIQSLRNMIDKIASIK